MAGRCLHSCRARVPACSKVVMNLTPEILAGGVAIVAVVFIAFRVRRRPPERSADRTRAPADMRFICGSCRGQFTHTRRTIAAWQGGSRRFFCNDCHKQWRRTHPTAAKPVERETSAAFPEGHRDRGFGPGPRLVRASNPGGGGCLGMVAVLVGVPVVAIAALRLLA